ncbi:protein abrupt-like isoform X2 [Photinus pyralis]|uniref:BTB domain-containing protein n=1 Tax=Photinus pyralis TaxID=7054 RepID=A0A1Y1JST5_PHOPY|nr:protein abrupt-like isoform X2 [Photinus pyralis]
MLPQQYCLRWRYHHSNLQTMFSQLLEREAFCDVTLACEGKTLKAHKIVLSACSTYFDTILSQYEEKDPILIMKDVKYVDIKCLVEFMYKGEINVDHCHLATLLKTAEELRIKGLAEVSWRDEEGNNDTSVNGVQSALPNVSTVMDSPKNEPPNKRKRGRPPIDDYEQAFTTPKITSVTGNAEEGYSNDALSSSDQDLSIWEEESAANDNDQTELDEPPPKIKSESLQEDDLLMDDSAMDLGPDSKFDLQSSGGQNKGNNGAKQSTNSSNSATTSCLTAAIEKEWPDVIKMNDYLSTGRRQQFWEEPFTKRVMDAIKTKNLEMKIAAELLGVSYGTLYGRYRDAYGCLKHPYSEKILTSPWDY